MRWDFTPSWHSARAFVRTSVSRFLYSEERRKDFTLVFYNRVNFMADLFPKIVSFSSKSSFLSSASPFCHWWHSFEQCATCSTRGREQCLETSCNPKESHRHSFIWALALLCCFMSNYSSLPSKQTGTILHPLAKQTVSKTTTAGLSGGESNGFDFGI